MLDYAGVRGAELSAAQKQQLLSLVDAYVGNMDDGHAQVKMDEVQTHLDDTYFAWIGGTDDTERLLLPHSQPGDPHRVRSSAPGGPAAPLSGDRPDAAARPRRDADAQRQRLRQGPAAPALPGPRARPVTRPQLVTSRLSPRGARSCFARGWACRAVALWRKAGARRLRAGLAASPRVGPRFAPRGATRYARRGVEPRPPLTTRGVTIAGESHHRGSIRAHARFTKPRRTAIDDLARHVGVDDSGMDEQRRQTAGVFPSRAATPATTSTTCRLRAVSDAAGSRRASAQAASTVPAHVRKSLAVKSCPVAVRTTR